MSQNSTTNTSRIPSFVLLVVLITFALSLVAVIFSLTITQQSSSAAWIMLGLGVLGMAISVYVLAETRKRISKLKIAVPPVITTLQCKGCNEKVVREFQRGDYIFKETDKCQKCKVNMMMITAIYREIKDKEKEKKGFQY